MTVKTSEVGLTKQFVVLVADDNPESIQVVCTALAEAGYHVRVASDGLQAMESLKEQPADLVLLDVHMPKLDGYEVCRQMKALPELHDIPVLFLSALNDPFNKVQGFELGAADFVSKPFHAKELLARVEVHLKIRNLQLEVESRNRELEVQNLRLQKHERTRDLFTHMLVHDLRGPLQAVLCGLEMLRDDGAVSPVSRGLIEDSVLGCSAMARLVSGILDVAQFEAGKLPVTSKAVNVRLCVDKAIQSLSGLARLRITECHQDGELPAIDCDPVLIDRVMVNLLDNAYKFSEETSPVDVTLSSNEQWMKVAVRDSGGGIPEPQRIQIFEKFNVLDSVIRSGRGSTGLGLAFCKMAVEAHGGCIGVESDEQQRTVFSFTLPLAGSSKQSGSQ